MFFSLTNSPTTFQRMMNTIFQSEVAKGWLLVYMDDMAIHTKPQDGETDEQHLQWHRTHVHHILDKLEQNDLYLKPEKCDFEQKQIKYLGVIVGQNKVHMDKKKVDQVADWKQPMNPTKVRSFLGFTGYYCYFIKDYSKIARPLLDLTKKAIAWNWGPKQQAAFVELRSRMCKEPVLMQPNFERRFYLQTDASGYGMGAILSQEGGTKDTPDTPDEPFKTHPKLHPIAYYSATFTPAECNYDIYERELLAVMKALSHW
jgi:hypothetical protein